jgi:hypothetical protein
VGVLVAASVGAEVGVAVSLSVGSDVSVDLVVCVGAGIAVGVGVCISVVASVSVGRAVSVAAIAAFAVASKSGVGVPPQAASNKLIKDKKRRGCFIAQPSVVALIEAA